MNFTEICKHNDLKVTPQRTAVYQAIEGCTTHPSADEVFQRVKLKVPNISYDTVNRTLLTFSTRGIIDIIESPGGVRRFDPQTNKHHHFHCLSCGKIVDFTCTEYDTISAPEELQKDYTIYKARVSLTGLCEECKNNHTGDIPREHSTGG